MKNDQNTGKKKATYEQLEAKVETLEADNKALRDAVQADKKRIAWLERQLFGSKSDKLKVKAADPIWPTLFDDQFEKAIAEKDKAIEKAVEEIKKESEKRRNKARKKSNRPAKYLYYGIEERTTTIMPESINPDEYDIIGQDVTHVLHREPAKVWVENIVRPICRRKGEVGKASPDIKQAPAPRAVIGGNHVAADFLAALINDKYHYHIPEYRQVKRLAEMGVQLSTSTVNEWVHAAANRLYCIYECQAEAVRRSAYLQIDGVPWRIADQEGKCRRGYAWQFRDTTDNSIGLYFYYLKGSRGGAVARAQLKGYHGAIQVDGFDVYDYFETDDGIDVLGCMAHVRRKFIDAQSYFPELAAEAVRRIDLLYSLEKNLEDRNASYEEIRKERQEKALPIMDAMETWMVAASTKCTPASSLGKALDYAYKLWPRLMRYANNGMYHIDNIDVERGQRPTVIGRKNYLFSQNDRGAEDNAIFYTLVESCEIVGVNPLEYLTYALNNVRDNMPEEELVRLLPYKYKEIQEKSQGK